MQCEQLKTFLFLFLKVDKLVVFFYEGSPGESEGERERLRKKIKISVVNTVTYTRARTQKITIPLRYNGIFYHTTAHTHTAYKILSKTKGYKSKRKNTQRGPGRDRKKKKDE